MTKTKTKEEIISWALVSAKFRFSPYEMRIRYAIIHELQKLVDTKMVGSGIAVNTSSDLFGFQNLEIPIPCCLKNENDENYTEVINALKTLRSKSIAVKIGNTTHVTGLILKASHVDNSGIINIVLDKLIVDAFLQYTKQFRRVDLKIAMSFKSAYTMRLYEIISRQHHPKVWHIATFRKYFDLEDKYANTHDFIKKTIKVAHDELIAAKSPYTFKYELNKKGRNLDTIEITPIWDKDLDRKYQHQLHLVEVVKKLDVNTDWVAKIFIKKLKMTDKELMNHVLFISKCVSNLKLYKANVDEMYDLIDRAENPKGAIIDYLRRKLGYKESLY